VAPERRTVTGLLRRFLLQETRGGHAVQAHHRLAAGRWAGFPDEAADAGGLKTPPGGAVLADHIVAVHLGNPLLIAAVAVVVSWRAGRCRRLRGYRGMSGRGLRPGGRVVGPGGGGRGVVGVAGGGAVVAAAPGGG